MKRKALITCGVIFGVMACVVILIWPMAPIWQKLGATPFCLEGDFPNLKIVDCPQAFVPASVTPLPLPTLGAQGPIPLIVDDDGSPDGMIALLYFLRNPLFEVKAVTISYGEAHPQVFAPHLAQLLAGLGRAEIPVGVGRETPLEGNNAFPGPWREGSDDFWGIKLPAADAASQPSPAARLIADTISASSQPVIVFISGAHTNLAEALRLEPALAQKIRGVYVMGGAIHRNGNIESDWPEIHNKVAEWNIWVDPQAASEVFAAGLPLHLVPLDATQQVLWSRADISGWTATGSPEAELAGEILVMMLDSFSVESAYIWDLVTAVQATNRAVCPEVPLTVEVLTAPGEEQGRTAVIEGAPNIGACLDPDAAQVKALVTSILGR